MNYSYNPSYTLQQQSPSPSELGSRKRSLSPSPKASSPSYQNYLLPLPLPSPPSHSHNNHQQQRSLYPTSSPYQQHHLSTPDLSSTLPHPSTSFTNGYASPAPSAYSSESGSKDEIDLMEPGTLGTSAYHTHPNLPGVDGIIARNPEPIYTNNYSPTNGTPHGRWTMRDFQLVQTVGTGTFGRVFLARFAQPRPNYPEFFALKILSKAECVRLRQVEHVNSEREILASTPSNLFMCLEYMVGGELFSHLRKEGRFVPDVAKFYAASIVLALEYLHDNDIIYRDLKPEVHLPLHYANENLLLDHQGYIKIIDFGFSKRCPDRTWTVCGTPEYLAPEIIRSNGHGKAVDWWALGILTYEMLVGYPPYYDSYPLGIYEKILAGNLTFPSFIDPAAKDLIRQLLRPELSSRLGNLKGGAQDVKDHLWLRYSDWDSLLRKRFKAPFVPRARWAGDAQYFERYEELSGEEVENLMNEVEGCGEDFGDLFEGF